MDEKDKPDDDEHTATCAVEYAVWRIQDGDTGREEAITRATRAHSGAPPEGWPLLRIREDAPEVIHLERDSEVSGAEFSRFIEAGGRIRTHGFRMVATGTVTLKVALLCAGHSSLANHCS